MKKKYHMDSEERHRHEAEFFDKWIDERIDPNALKVTLETTGKIENVLRSVGVSGNLKGKRVLDCGCGSGLLSTYFALKGCSVCGIDISPKCVDATRQRAEVSGVGSYVEARVMSMEELSYPDNHFNIVVGKFVLHHVDVNRAGREVFRVLRQGGKAIFLENNANNKILMLSRKLLTGRFGIPKLSDDVEYPLTAHELHILQEIFDGQCYSRYIDFVFFGMLNRYVFRNGFKPISLFLSWLDTLAFKFLPFLRKYGYYQLVSLEKTIW